MHLCRGKSSVSQGHQVCKCTYMLWFHYSFCFKFVIKTNLILITFIRENKYQTGVGKFKPSTCFVAIKLEHTHSELCVQNWSYSVSILHVKLSSYHIKITTLFTLMECKLRYKKKKQLTVNLPFLFYTLSFLLLS